MRELSSKEVEILQLMANGESNKAIGRLLDRAEATIKVHRKSMYRKMNAKNGEQAVAIGLRKGIIQ